MNHFILKFPVLFWFLPLLKSNSEKIARTGTLNLKTVFSVAWSAIRESNEKDGMQRTRKMERFLPGMKIRDSNSRETPRALTTPGLVIITGLIHLSF